MPETEFQALFKIAAELQKEIRDLKKDQDNIWKTVAELEKTIKILVK